MKNLIIIAITLPFLFTSCIGDNFVSDRIDPVLRITNAIDTLGLGDTYQFKAQYLNNIGMEEIVPKNWISTDESVISIDDVGLATPNQMGQTTIRVELTVDNLTLSDERIVQVSDETVIVSTMRTGSLKSTSSYLLMGDFTLSDESGALLLSLANNYAASTSLPGLYAYLTNNPNTISGALELGKVEVFSGGHAYTIPENVALNDYRYVLYFCKPFNVKVGDGEFVN